MQTAEGVATLRRVPRLEFRFFRFLVALLHRLCPLAVLRRNAPKRVLMKIVIDAARVRALYARAGAVAIWGASLIASSQMALNRSKELERVRW